MIKTALYVLAGFILLGFIFKGCSGKDNESEEEKENPQTNVPAPSLPCMCSAEEMEREGLTFSHVGREVTLNEGQTFVWERPDGYVAKVCAFHGKIERLSQDGDNVLRIKAIENTPKVMVRYYTKSY